MATFVFGMNQSLDGYVDHTAFAPDAALFQHFVEQTRVQAGMIYGRRMYEVMRYWDEASPEWEAAERAYAEAWCSKPKWVVSTSLTSVGPNATLVGHDVEAELRQLKGAVDGVIEVAGPELARRLGDMGLIDQYSLYVHPVVLGSGKPLFAGPLPRLRLMAHDVMSSSVIRLTYVPA
ncbi:MAG: dihydrofolate reductase family protein [Luteibacter sp.]